jgi:hypothetical protein
VPREVQKVALYYENLKGAAGGQEVNLTVWIGARLPAKLQETGGFGRRAAGITGDYSDSWEAQPRQ